jgi:NAD(P) transhydrogenase
MVGVGGFFIMGGGLVPHTFPQVLGALSVLLAFVNVSGGFVITKRMLDMFKSMPRIFDLYFLTFTYMHHP